MERDPSMPTKASAVPVDARAGLARGLSQLFGESTYVPPPSSIVTTLLGDGGTVTWQSPEQMVEGIQVLESIGSGASGVVYKGLFEKADVAIKIVPGLRPQMPRQIVSSRGGLRMRISLLARASIGLDKSMLREVMLSSQLRHPNVVHTRLVRGAILTADFIAEVFSGTLGSKQAPAPARSSEDMGKQAPPSAHSGEDTGKLMLSSASALACAYPI
ncbi:hypothetical protein TSOC_005605 [Tetrabaena socialis]|uniref:Protein kinase domain-containing protein n=1 Tax=Tetrabaena socialis TaxID=47790 RepID=A0A2J8A5V8_9CHLO|nr:hypothetical protein TSOC_005605 [Tetrabaena socialis]|eukprot:PNH07909.1 hypothetical protein TSOC_005605 [Tetrabaena socialis]